MSSRTIVIVAPPGATLQDVTGPWEVFSRAAVYSPETYRVIAASVDADPAVSTKFGLGLVCQTSIRDLALPLDTVLVSGSDQVFSAPLDQGFLDWLRARAKDTRRVGSVCTGAFYLAQAGLLDGRRATTHWRYIPRLREEFPNVQVEAEPIFVRDESVYTSAGITAGIDLALALVEEDCGPLVAQAVARDLVVFLHRPADQEQISAALAQRMADRRPIRFVQQWAPGHLDAISSVDDLAALVSMSPRNFARLFRRETGETPGQFIRRLRVDAATRRLHERAGGAEKVASQVGFGSGRTLRRALRRVGR
jgi:transcriptional regulator GlxA family with amidase domain